MTYYPKIGSVSEGTLRTEDLLDTFAGELAYHMKRMRLTREQRKRFTYYLKEYHNRAGDVIANHIADRMLDDLQDALTEIAPPYAYFGTAGGDGACFGFWPAIDLHHCDEPERIAEITREHWGCDVVLVNDHGNAECGYVDKRGKFHEYWSCV